MPSLLLYRLKLSISLSIVWIFYQLCLRRLTFYKLNRWYLLGYSVLAFFIPLINIGPMLWDGPAGEPLVVQYIPSIGTVPAAVFAPVEAAPVLTGRAVVFLIFVLGAVLLLVRSVVRWLSLRRLRSRARLIVSEGLRDSEGLIVSEGLKIYQVDAPIIPFSFGSAIYINRHLHTEKEWSDIILHEYVHIRQKHTVDILLAELICVLNWYNPFCWLIRHSIRQNLEFIADSQVLDSGVDKKGYQYHLLQVIGEPQYQLANNFNFSSLKKRIVMMNKIRSARLHLLKLLFLGPLVAVLLLAFRDRYPDLLHRPSGPIYVNAVGIVISLPGKTPLAGVAVLDKAAGMETTTDANGYYMLKIPVAGDSVRVHLDFIKNGYDNDFRERYWPVLKETEGMVDVGTMNQALLPREGIFFIAPGQNGERAPADPGFDDAETELHRIIKENVELKDYLAMEKAHPEVGLFYVTEGHQTRIVIHTDGAIEKYTAAGQPSFSDMDKKYGALPAFMGGYNHQVNSGYLARWAGISAQAEKEFHATGEARAIIFPGDSRVIAVPLSGKPQVYDMDNSDPKERPAFESRYGKLPDCVPAPGFNTGAVPAAVGAVPVVVSHQDTSRPTLILDGRHLSDSAKKEVARRRSSDSLLQVIVLRHASDTSHLPSDPLYVVNGQQMPDHWSKDSISPADIYSIDVLKGEQAIRYFGEKGANGVVAITTKSFHVWNAPSIIADKMPLYIVDGKDAPADTLKTLNPDDIESITVLKDQSGIARYGEKGKNGVILITLKTKRTSAVTPHGYLTMNSMMKDGPLNAAADAILAKK
jgi:TonB-dependent SusC/RagA subfamily outer membrane receptor